MKKQLLLALLIGATSAVFAQTTINVRVSNGSDDHEELINGSVPQSGTVGDMDPGSSDLELGNADPTADPQLVGIRFPGIAIPANATILNAYIQFAVDATNKNTDPCVLTVQVEDNINPATFSDNPFSLSTRSVLTSSVTWNVSGASWGTVGSAGADQRTPDLKSLVQSLVNKSGWVSGNAMAFYIKGTGTREVEAFEGDAAKAPELVIQFSAVTGIKEITQKLDATIFPNPFKSSFNVQYGLEGNSDVVVSIYDMTGKLISEKTISNVSAGTHNYNPALKLETGMYFVKIKTNNDQKILKVIAE